MANLQGYTMGAIGNILNHHTRHDADPRQEKYSYQNQKIDTSKTHLNYSIFEREDPRGFIAAKIAEADIKPTKTTNVISDWIITLPKSIRLEGRKREFFEQAYAFLEDKVGGADNIVGAWVHLDETSPHMHFCFVPSCESIKMTNDKSQPLRWTTSDEKKNPEHKTGEVKRDNKGTVRYKRVAATDKNGAQIVNKTISQTKMFDRKTMQTFHPELGKHMQQHFGFDVGIELQDAGDKVLSRLDHLEYKAAKTALTQTKTAMVKAAANLERLEDKREEIQQQTAQESTRLERLQKTRKRAEGRVEVLETITSECRATDNASLSRKGGFLNRISSICNGWIERFCAAIEVVKTEAKKPLTIAISPTTEMDSSFRISKRDTGSAAVLPTQLPTRQLEKGYTPQFGG